MHTRTKLFAAALALMTTCAFAQTTNTPTSQPPTGEKLKFQKASEVTDHPAPKATPADRPTTREGKRAARKAKREAKVGDKPLN